MTRHSALTGTLLFALSWISGYSWNYEGHRAVNLLALQTLPREFPAFVQEDPVAERIAFLSGEADRWRNINEPVAKHINSPDHYIDIEDLERLGLSLESVNPLRHLYTAQVFEARAKDPKHFPPINPAQDADGTRALPGFLPWAITENYHKLQSAFSYLAVLEELGSESEIANARANVAYYMGILGHFVGDGAQPLHTTASHNGWEGPNPEGFTTKRSIHSWIDGGFFEKTGGIDAKELARHITPAKRIPTPSAVDHRDPIFKQAVSYLETQYALVVPLYRLERDGGFTPGNERAEEGRKLLDEQICAAAQMLGNLWLTAWKEAPPDKFLRGELLRRRAETGRKPVKAGAANPES